jgi:hypothetical protein
MNTFIRIIAILLIVIGILVMAVGVVSGVTGAEHLVERNFSIESSPGLPFLMAPRQVDEGFGILAGIVIFIQGLILTGVGGGAFMLADIAKNTSTTNRRKINRPSEPSGQS